MMPMTHWKQYPSILRRKFLLTIFAGVFCSTVATVVYLISNDRALLIMGCIILIICIGKAVSIWRCAADGHYHVHTGICCIPKGYSPLRLRKVLFVSHDGKTVTLLLDRNAGITEGFCYRLYLQNNSNAADNTSMLNDALRTDTLIGFERIDPEDLSK